MNNNETPFAKIEALSMAISAIKGVFVRDIKVKDGIIEIASDLLLKELEKLEKDQLI